jgi:hypothetical protein
MTVWIFFCIFWSTCLRCWFVIFASLNEKKIIECDDSLWFLNVFEWRFFSFCSMTFETSSRILSDNEIFLKNSAKFLNDSAKFWTEKLKSSTEFVKQSTADFAKFFEKSIDDSVIFLI